MQSNTCDVCFSFVHHIFSTSHEGGDGCTLVLLLVSAYLNSLRTNITTAQLFIYSSNTQVELSLKYMMYRNAHRSGTNLTTVSLSFITTASYDMYHI